MKSRLVYWPLLVAALGAMVYETFLPRPRSVIFVVALTALTFCVIGLGDAREAVLRRRRGR